jgi:peptide/nickel transport system substrate-binding protein
MLDYDILGTVTDTVTMLPGIVQKWEMAPDGLSWVFTVRKGVKFHNGDPVMAKDIKFSLERYASPQAMYSYIRDSMDHAELIDDYTLRIYTKGPQPYFAYYTSMLGSGSTGLVMPMDYFQQHGQDYYKQHPIGSGPWKFVRHVPADSIEFEAVTNHWRQTPAFKNLTLILMPEETTRLASLKTGAVDVIDVSIQGAADAKAAGYKYAALSTNTDHILFYGTYEPEAATLPTADVRVRQALSYAINREEIRKTILMGMAGPPPAGFALYESLDMDAAYWKDYIAKIYTYDPNKAKQLLKDAGYEKGFTIKMYSFNQGGAPYLPQLAEVVAGYWQKIGVNVQLTPIDYGTIKIWRKGGKNGGPVPELLGQASAYASSEDRLTANKLQTSYLGGGTCNLFAHAKPELDALIKAAMSEADATKRRAEIAQALQIGVDAYVNLGLSTSPSLAAMGPRVDINFPQATKAIPMFADIATHGTQK